MRVLMICVTALLACSACASVVPSPVTNDYRSGYALSSISVQLPAEDKFRTATMLRSTVFWRLDDRIDGEDEAAFRRVGGERGG